MQQPHREAGGDGGAGQRLVAAGGHVPGEQLLHQRGRHGGVAGRVLAQPPQVDGPGPQLGQRVDPDPVAGAPERQLADEVAVAAQVVDVFAVTGRGVLAGVAVVDDVDEGGGPQRRAHRLVTPEHVRTDALVHQ
ncbi:MAG TPA: hypothetical protein VFV66_15185 [Nonomuraea sp.]|nr:hypothetical protein [Nonomuraea sp.]